MIEKVKVQGILEDINSIVKKLRENQLNATRNIPNMLAAIASMMGAFFNEVNIENWQQEVMLQRLDKLNRAYEKEDIIWLADVLEFEIADCIAFVIENIE